MGSIGIAPRVTLVATGCRWTTVPVSIEGTSWWPAGLIGKYLISRTGATPDDRLLRENGGGIATLANTFGKRKE